MPSASAGGMCVFAISERGRGGPGLGELRGVDVPSLCESFGTVPYSPSLWVDSIDMRQNVIELKRLGRFPASVGPGGEMPTDELIVAQERLVLSLQPPFSDEELAVLLSIFRPDDYFGLAQTLVHRIESAAQWRSVGKTLLDGADQSNDWIGLMLKRLNNAAQVNEAPRED